MVLTAHGGESYVKYLTDYVHGAATIPHGIEEMAWDAYLHGESRTIWLALHVDIPLAGHPRYKPRGPYIESPRLCSGRLGAAATQSAILRASVAPCWPRLSGQQYHAGSLMAMLAIIFFSPRSHSLPLVGALRGYGCEL